MEREVRREKKLPAFILSVNDLEILASKILLLFPPGCTPLLEVTVKLRDETLRFEDIEELKDYRFGATQIVSFSLFCTSSPSRRSISISTFLDQLSSVLARGQDEAWCAGAVETVYCYLKEFKQWYSFVYSPITFGLALIFSSLLTFATGRPAVSFMGVSTEKLSPVSWAVLLCVFILIFLREKVLPPARLRLVENQNFVRRYNAELTVAIAFGALLIAAYTAFGGKS